MLSRYIWIFGVSNLYCVLYLKNRFKQQLNLNASLKAPEGPYSIVLPICEECMDKGLHMIVRAARQNAEAKQARLDSQAT